MTPKSLMDTFLCFWDHGDKGAFFDKDRAHPKNADYEEVQTLLRHGFLLVHEGSAHHGPGSLTFDSKGMTKAEAREEMARLTSK